MCWTMDWCWRKGIFNTVFADGAIEGKGIDLQRGILFLLK